MDILKITLTHKDFRSVRKILDLNQQDLANKLGISKSTIVSYENNKREIPKYIRLALLLLLITKYFTLEIKN